MQPRFQALLADGAKAQRPLWASTGVKNPDYPDTLYVTELVAPNTVNTMPEKTLDALADHGEIDLLVRVVRQTSVCECSLAAKLESFRRADRSRGRCRLGSDPSISAERADLREPPFRRHHRSDRSLPSVVV